jgi:hypothetical protein
VPKLRYGGLEVREPKRKERTGIAGKILRVRMKRRRWSSMVLGMR